MAQEFQKCQLILDLLARNTLSWGVLNFVWGNLWNFKSLLVAPATLGLLAPMSATANEVTFSDFNLLKNLL